MDFMSVQEAAKLWKVSQRWVQKFCEDGRITEVKKFGRSWMIPVSAQKPLDPRKSKEQKGRKRDE